MTKIGIDLLNENVINEISVIIAVATFYILLGIEDDILSQKYLKKFVILCYFLFTLIYIVFEVPLVVTIFIFLFIFFISSLNMMEHSCDVEKNLNRKSLFIFSLIKWFYHTKLYIFIGFSLCCIAILQLINSETIAMLMLLAGLIWHQMSFTKDMFGYKSFEFLLNTLTFYKTSSESFLNFASEEIEERSSIIAFILFMEDKDFFERKNVTSGIKRVYERNKLRYIDIIKEMKLKFFSYNNLKRIFKKHLRGYSTIEMQVVRNTVLKQDSYQYTFRRKVLIELFYTEFFIKALQNRLTRYNSKDYNTDKCKTLGNIYSAIKILFLQYYYFKILNSPKNLEEFKMNTTSRLTNEDYDHFYELFEENNHGFEYQNYFKLHMENFNKIFIMEDKKMNNSIVNYDNGMITVNNKENTLHVERSGASTPLVSPNGSKIIYIHPFEWETEGTLYVFDIDKIEKTPLVFPTDDSYSPKKFTWLSDNLIAIIIGYTYGTLAVGGNVFLYNLTDKKLERLTKFEDSIQITDIEVENERTLILKGIQYIDDQYINKENFVEKVSI